MTHLGAHKSEHWTVCQVLSTRAHLIRADIERAGKGVFCPTYASVRYVDGKRSATERQLLPGYLFVCTDGPQDFYDGYGVKIARAIGRVGEDEFNRLSVGHATGLWNEVASGEPAERRPYSVRRPRPRPGKRALMKQNGKAA